MSQIYCSVLSAVSVADEAEADRRKLRLSLDAEKVKDVKHKSLDSPSQVSTSAGAGQIYILSGLTLRPTAPFPPHLALS